MKTWAFLISIFCFLFIGLTAAFGQEAGMSGLEAAVESGTEGGRATFAPGEEVRYVPQTPGYVADADSIMLQLSDFPMQRAAQRPPAGEAAEKQKTKDDDSILTFNFLYYIIQKYKLQDIID